MKLSGPISSKVLAFTGAGAKINWDASWNRDSAKALVATRTKNPPIGDMISTNFAVVKLPAALITGTWPKGGTSGFVLFVPEGGRGWTGRGCGLECPRGQPTRTDRPKATSAHHSEASWSHACLGRRLVGLLKGRATLSGGRHLLGPPPTHQGESLLPTTFHPFTLPSHWCIVHRLCKLAPAFQDLLCPIAF